MDQSGYRHIDHTADVALELWAPTEEELLRVGARAIVELLTDAAGVAEGSQLEPRRIEIDAVDGEDRLVQWLNEVLVAALVDGFLIADAAIELARGSLVAEARGQAGASGRVTTELKSATYHDLMLQRTGEGWRARVVIDV